WRCPRMPESARDAWAARSANLPRRGEKRPSSAFGTFSPLAGRREKEHVPACGEKAKVTGPACGGKGKRARAPPAGRRKKEHVRRSRGEGKENVPRARGEGWRASLHDALPVLAMSEDARISKGCVGNAIGEPATPGRKAPLI